MCIYTEKEKEIVLHVKYKRTSEHLDTCFCSDVHCCMHLHVQRLFVAGGVSRTFRLARPHALLELSIRCGNAQRQEQHKQHKQRTQQQKPSQSRTRANCTHPSSARVGQQSDIDLFCSIALNIHTTMPAPWSRLSRLLIFARYRRSCTSTDAEHIASKLLQAHFKNSFSPPSLVFSSCIFHR